MELLVSLILLEKTCMFVKYSTLVSSWHVMLQSAHNTECQYFAGNKLGEKSLEMGNQWTSRTFRDKTACRKFYTFCLLIFLKNWWLPYKEWDRRIHSNWKVKKFLSNSSEDTHAIAIVNCIKKKVPCHSNDCRLKSTLLYKARHLKDKTFFWNLY